MSEAVAAHARIVGLVPWGSRQAIVLSTGRPSSDAEEEGQPICLVVPGLQEPPSSPGGALGDASLASEVTSVLGLDSSQARCLHCSQGLPVSAAFTVREAGNVRTALRAAQDVVQACLELQERGCVIIGAHAEQCTLSADGGVLLPEDCVVKAEGAEAKAWCLTTPAALTAIRQLVGGRLAQHAAPEVVSACDAGMETLPVAAQNAWAAGCLIFHLVDRTGVLPHPRVPGGVPFFSTESWGQATVPCTGDPGASRSSAAWTALRSVVQALLQPEADSRLPLQAAQAALGRVLETLSIHTTGDSALGAGAQMQVYVPEPAEDGSIELKAHSVPLPETGLLTSTESLAKAVHAHLQACGALSEDVSAVHLSLKARGQSLPERVAYSFLDSAAASPTLAQTGLCLAPGQGTVRVLQEIIVTTSPSDLPPACVLAGATGQMLAKAHVLTNSRPGQDAAQRPTAPNKEACAGQASPSPAAAAASAGAGDDAAATASPTPGEDLAKLVELATRRPTHEAAPTPSFVVSGFSQSERNPSVTVSDGCASSQQWGSAMCTVQGTERLDSGKHSWAFQVAQKAASGGICIGVATAEFDAPTKNLGPAQHTWGYSSSGKRSAGFPEFQPFAQGFSSGDVVGVYLDCDAGTLSFARNGVMLGVAFSDLKGKSVMPAVCMGGRASKSSHRPTVHKLRVLTSEEQYTKALQQARLRNPADLPSADFAWCGAGLPAARLPAPEATPTFPVVCGGGWEAALPAPTLDSSTDLAVPAMVVPLQHPALSQACGVSPSGRYAFKFAVGTLDTDAEVWFCLVPHSALPDSDAVVAEAAPAHLPSPGLCQPGVWAVSSQGRVIAAGKLGETARFPALREGDCLGLEVGLPVEPDQGPAQGPTFEDLPTLAVTVNGAPAAELLPPLAQEAPQRSVFWAGALELGGLHPCVAVVEASTEASLAVVRSVEVPRMFSVQNANSHITAAGAGSSVTCASQWASAPIVHGGLTRGKHTWTLHMTEKAAAGGACIGVARPDFPFRSRNVGAFAGSWGWSSSGTKGNGQGAFIAYGERFEAGDKVGVELDCDEGTLRFHKNGVDQGIAFATGLKGVPLVPAVCLGGTRSRKSAPSTSVAGNHTLCLVPTTLGIAEYQAAADSALDAGSLRTIGTGAKGEVSDDGQRLSFSCEGSAPTHDAGITVKAGPSVPFAAEGPTTKVRWTFRVDELHLQERIAGEAVRDTLMASGADTDGWRAAVADWLWQMRGDVGHTLSAAAHSRMLGEESDVPVVDAAAEEGEARVAHVHAGITIGLASSEFFASETPAAGVGCDASGLSAGITSVGLVVQGGKAHPAPGSSTQGDSLLCLPALSPGDVVCLTVAPGEAEDGKAAHSAKGQQGSSTTTGPSTGMTPIKLAPAQAEASKQTGQGAGTATTAPASDKTATAQPEAEAPAPCMPYSVTLSVNGQDLGQPLSQALLPRIEAGQALVPALSIGHGVASAALTLLSTAPASDAAVQASMQRRKREAHLCTFLSPPSEVLGHSVLEDGQVATFSRRWATAAIAAGVPLKLAQRRTRAQCATAEPSPVPETSPVFPTHGIPPNSGIHAFQLYCSTKASGGDIVVGFVSAAPESPFNWASWQLGANSASWGVAGTGARGGGWLKGGEGWLPFTPEAGDTPPKPLFTSGSIVQWFVDSDLDEEGQARFGVRVDGQFTGLALTIPSCAFPLVPAVCGGGATAATAHRVQLQEVPLAVDRGQASKRLQLSKRDSIITCKSTWGSAFVTHSGMSTGKYTWSWKVLQGSTSGAVCVGVADLNRFQVTSRNVGADNHSWAYSSAGKRSGSKSGEFQSYGSPFSTGDIVGVTLDCDKKQLSFSCNGTSHGVAVTRGLNACSSLVPAACIGSTKQGAVHSLALLPALTVQQVHHALASPWRSTWSPSLDQSNNTQASSPGVEGTPVPLNLPPAAHFDGGGAPSQDAAAVEG